MKSNNQSYTRGRSTYTKTDSQSRVRSLIRAKSLNQKTIDVTNKRRTELINLSKTLLSCNINLKRSGSYEILKLELVDFPGEQERTRTGLVKSESPRFSSSFSAVKVGKRKEIQWKMGILCRIRVLSLLQRSQNSEFNSRVSLTPFSIMKWRV